MQLKLSFEKNISDTTKVIVLNKSIARSDLLDRVRTPLRYPGSKFNAAKYIAPFWNLIEHDEYREPFLGSGAIFFTKPKANINWLNDIDSELIITFKVIQHPKHRKELIKLIQRYNPSKENFEELKKHKPKNKIEIACKYFLINRTAYSGIMNLPNWGFHPTKSVQPHQWPHRIEVAGEKLEGVKITHMDYEYIFNTKKGGRQIFYFIDPPYFKADQKRAYVYSFNIEDHMKLLENLKSLRDYFCLTYDNCEEIKKLYNWANVHEIEWRYHTSNSNHTTRKMGKELIITNY